MYCNQCEQASGGVACTTRGVCGKTPEASALQDLIVYALRGMAVYAHAGRSVGVVDEEADRFAASALFATVTNVDFDDERLATIVDEVAEHTARLRIAVGAAGVTVDTEDPAALFSPADTVAGKIEQGESVGLFTDSERDDDVRSLQMTAVYGLKGLAAYVDHARVLGHEDPEVYAFIHRLLASLTDPSLDLQAWTGLALETGGVNLRAMELLDAGNTGTYGHPVPTEVPLGHRAGKAILVSGHDLHDLAVLLEQTEGTGIDVYTHGEMLPTHGYPELKKHAHFYGHFGTGWQNQRREFAEFPGAILMTTNCIQAPREDYTENVFTTGLVAWPGVTHVPNDDFSSVIERARALPGFETDADAGSVMVGFGRSAVLGVAPQVIDAVKEGAIRHFFLVGGCDGAAPGRSYYTDFVDQTPDDTVVLTLACGKFRFFDHDLGDIGGIPRLLDVGQCNDAYSAVQIAVALADAFGMEVNELPLSLVLSWYEQKAVAILLSLLHLGITDIRLGPSLPAFVTPNVLQVLIDAFGIKPISEPATEDLDAILGAPVGAGA
jgi:hydroxylamine reductase